MFYSPSHRNDLLAVGQYIRGQSQLMAPIMQYRPHRYQTQFPIQLSTPVGPQQCRVIDVNNSGARITSTAKLQRGDKVKFRVLNAEVAAIVSWATGDKAGLIFRPQLSSVLVDTLRYRKDAPRGPQRGTVGFAFAEM